MAVITAEAEAVTLLLSTSTKSRTPARSLRPSLCYIHTKKRDENIKAKVELDEIFLLLSANEARYIQGMERVMSR